MIGAIAVLFAISVLVFLIFNVVPATNPAQRIAGKNATPTLIKSVEKEWGFDKPLPAQYWTQMKLIFTGKVESYSSPTSRRQADPRRYPGDRFLMYRRGDHLARSSGSSFGYLSAVRAGGLLDKALTVCRLGGISMPVFWLASILLYYLTYKIEIFPNGGYVRSPKPVAVGQPPGPALDHARDPLRRLLQPRAALEHARRDGRGLRAHRARQGLSERRVMTRHVLRNSLIPIITLFGLDFGALIGGGAIVTEYDVQHRRRRPLHAESLKQHDFPSIMAVTLFGAFFIVLFNALVDVAYAYLDPRIRLGTADERHPRAPRPSR